MTTVFRTQEHLESVIVRLQAMIRRNEAVLDSGLLDEGTDLLTVRLQLLKADLARLEKQWEGTLLPSRSNWYQRLVIDRLKYGFLYGLWGGWKFVFNWSPQKDLQYLQGDRFVVAELEQVSC